MIAALLASRFLPVALASVASFGAGSAAGYWVKGTLDRPVIAEARQAAVDMEVRFKNFVSDVAMEAARASAQALAEQTALAAELSRARTRIATEQIARQRASQALLENLRNAPRTDASRQSPGSVAFWRGMRERQLAARAKNPPAENRNALPATP